MTKRDAVLPVPMGDPPRVWGRRELLSVSAPRFVLSTGEGTVFSASVSSVPVASGPVGTRCSASACLRVSQGGGGAPGGRARQCSWPPAPGGRGCLLAAPAEVTQVLPARYSGQVTTCVGANTVPSGQGGEQTSASLWAGLVSRFACDLPIRRCRPACTPTPRRAACRGRPTPSDVT